MNVEAIAGIQIVLLSNGEIQCQVKGVTQERFQRMMCDAISLVSAKFKEQAEDREPKIEVPKNGWVPPATRFDIRG